MQDSLVWPSLASIIYYICWYLIYSGRKNVKLLIADKLCEMKKWRVLVNNQIPPMRCQILGENRKVCCLDEEANESKLSMNELKQKRMMSEFTSWQVSKCQTLLKSSIRSLKVGLSYRGGALTDSWTVEFEMFTCSPAVIPGVMGSMFIGACCSLPVSVF